jgi:uncharacterized protein
MTFIYLHGFTSGPQSFKATYLRDRFAELGLKLEIPDLNQGDFSHLTFTRQIKQVIALLPPEPVTLLGSSLGGLTAAWVADRQSQVEQLILLAPAFGFLQHWLGTFSTEQLQTWQVAGYLPFYHHAEKRELPLHYQFVHDLQQYRSSVLTHPVPTLILHGLQDSVIPISASREFAASRSWVNLIELNDDHELKASSERIWQQIQLALKTGS